LHSGHDYVSFIPPFLSPYVPTGHKVHTDCSDNPFYVPAWHLAHLISPFLSCYVPLGQSTGSSKPYLSHLFPTGQSLQSLTWSDPVEGI